MRFNAGVTLTICLCLTFSVSGQTTPPRDDLKMLRAADWQSRSRAFDVIDHQKARWRSSALSSALFDLLEREDREVEARAAAGRSVDQDGEEYGEYLHDVVMACAAFCDKQLFLSRLLHNARSGARFQFDGVRELGLFRSLFATNQRRSIDDAIIKAASERRSFLVRAVAVANVKAILVTDTLLPRDHRTRLHEVILRATSDEAYDVRRAAVRALVTVGLPSDIPVLESLAVNDPARFSRAGGTVYPVRDVAREAIAAIRRRAPH